MQQYLISLFLFIPVITLGNPWSRWTPCTRTCGGGLSSRMRPCSEGDLNSYIEEIQYKVCSIRACPKRVGSFRQEQCASFNDKPYQGSLYEWITDPDHEYSCQLHCIARGHELSAVLAEKVMDGTRCSSSPKTVCIAGECQRAGCDNIVGSVKRRDACGVCGGNSTSCDPQSRTQSRYNEEDEDEEEVDEFDDPRRDEALESLQTISRDNREDNDDRMSGQVRALSAVEGAQTRDNIEDSHPPSPAQELVREERGEGKRAQYQNDEHIYSLVDLPEYLWQETTFSACSVTCGEGMERTGIICVNIRLRQPVPQEFCSRSRKPIHRERVCDTGIPCGSPPRWSTGIWGDCSVSCGGGIAERPVYCVRPLDSGTLVQIDPDLCEGQIPEARRRCNEFVCPVWHAGQWSPCSVSCGAGEQFRAVVCKRLTDEVDCRPDEKPAEKQICHTGVICLANLGIKRLPEHENNVVVDNKPFTNSRQTKRPTQVPVQDPGRSSYGEFRGNPGIEWRDRYDVYNYQYSAFEDEFDYRDYTYRAAEYNGNDLVDQMGIGRDYDYRGNEMMASHGGPDGSGEVNNEIPWYRTDSPSFVASRWSECSVTCGFGVRKRFVQCKVFVAYSNSFQELPESRCTGPKPADVDECTMPNCPILVASQEGETYAWQFAGYGACSETCGGGLRDPIFFCIRPDPLRHIQVDESLCSRLAKPRGVLRQSCNAFLCPASLSRTEYRWRILPFGACSHACGGGVAQRQVDCVMDSGPGTQALRVPDQLCLDIGLTLPARTELCNQAPCPPAWVEAEWSQCSATCGQGFRHRQVLCKQIVPPARKLDILNDEYCPGEKPESIIPCASEQPCYKDFEMVPDPSHYVQLQPQDHIRLVAGGTAVLIPGTKIQVECPVTNGFNRRDILWRKGDELVGRKGRMKKSARGVLIFRKLTWQDAGIYSCHADSKDAVFVISLHGLNDALKKHQQRGEVRSQEFLRRVSSFASERSKELTEPFIDKQFAGEALPYRFVTSGWGPCSISCGGAGLQHREVTCELNFDKHYLLVHDDRCYEQGQDRPLPTKDCGFDQCPHWEEGQYRHCTDEFCLAPDTGARVRPLFCIGPDGSQLSHSMCDQHNKPQDKLPCYKETCIAAWTESNWTECSRTCGGQGYMTRSLLCVWLPNGLPANGYCQDQRKPDVIRACDTPACPAPSECRDSSTYCSLVEMMNLCRYPEYRTTCCVSCTLLRTKYIYRH